MVIQTISTSILLVIATGTLIVTPLVSAGTETALPALGRIASGILGGIRRRITQALPDRIVGMARGGPPSFVVGKLRTVHGRSYARQITTNGYWNGYENLRSA